MKVRLLTVIALFLAMATARAGEPIPGVVLGVHGGSAGSKEGVTPEQQKRLRAGLERALKAGYTALNRPGGTSLDAVETAIRVLEDDPWFNAGKGAVFTHEGRNELDASIMEGRLKRAGAVASVTVVKNPISAARAVMEKSRHVLLVSRGAELFAQEVGLDIVDRAYFRTEERWQELQEELREERDKAKQRDTKKDCGEEQANTSDAEQRGPSDRPSLTLRATRAASLPRHEWSTVGAVALDAAGNLAAGTSTGGTSNKCSGRVGDSPIIGAGTYADNASCAVSCTGHGEYFIRYAAAHDIAALMEYKGFAVQAAADEVLLHKLKDAGGRGAAIALDAKGNFAASHNTPGLHRGYVTQDGKITVLLYDE